MELLYLLKVALFYSHISNFSPWQPLGFHSNFQDPSFQEIPSESNFEGYTQRIGIDITLNQNISSTYRNSQDFYSSSITIENAKFDNLNAFGGDFAGPLGGAIYTYMSNMLVQGSTFCNCKASTGGSILTIETNILMMKTKIDSNIACNDGGGIYFQGSSSSQITLQIVETSFLNNIAFASGGAICVESQSNVYLQNVQAFYNQAHIQGGALFVANSDINIFYSKFQKNIAGHTTFNTGHKTIKFTFGMPRFTARGCGGFAHIASNQGKYTIHTNNNCFRDNYMINGAISTLDIKKPNQTSDDNIGKDVMIENNTFWISIEDQIGDYLFLSSEFTKWMFTGNQTKCDEEVGSNTTFFSTLMEGKTYTNGTTKFDYARSSNNAPDATVSSVPSPTGYTYYATPIHITTQTKTFYAKSSMWQFITTITVRQTFGSTPFSTVHSTAHLTPYITPHSTPHSTAYFTPHSTAHSTPQSTPIRTINPSPTFLPPYEPPPATENPLNGNIPDFLIVSPYNTTIVSFTAIPTNLSNTYTYLITETTALSPIFNVTTVTYTVTSSFTTTATEIESTNSIYVPTFIDNQTSFTYSRINTSTQLYTWSFTTSASNVVTVTYTNTNATFTNTTISSNGIYSAFSLIHITTLTYTNNSGKPSLTYTKTEYYNLTQAGPGTSVLFTYIKGDDYSMQTITYTTTDYKGSTFTLSTLSTQTIPSISTFVPSNPSTIVQINTNIITGSNIITSGISYFSGYLKATSNTYVEIYAPSYLLSSTLTTVDQSETYTYTIVTSLTKTYSSVSFGQIYVSYISISTNYETRTTSATVVSTNVTYTLTNTFINSSTLSYSLENGKIYTLSQTTIKHKSIPFITAILSPMITMTSTFTNVSNVVTYTFTEAIYNATQINAPFYTLDTLDITYVASAIPSTTSYAQINTSTSVISPTITNISYPIINATTFNNYEFSNLLNVSTNTSTFAILETDTLVPTITDHYTASAAFISEIWTNQSVYKSTIHDKTMAYMKTNTFTKVITNIPQGSKISTVINVSARTYTQVYKYTKTMTIPDDLGLSPTHTFEKEIFSISTISVSGYSLIHNTTLSSTQTTFYFPYSTATITNTIVDVPYSIYNGNLTLTINQTATNISTVLSTMTESLIYITSTTTLENVYQIDTSKSTNTLKAVKTNDASLITTPIAPVNKYTPFIATPNPTINLLYTSTLTDVKVPIKTNVAAYSYTIAKVLNTITSYLTAITCYSSFLTSIEGTITETYDQTTSYTITYIYAGNDPITYTVYIQHGTKEIYTYSFNNSETYTEYYVWSYKTSSALTYSPTSASTYTIIYSGVQRTANESFGTVVYIPSYSYFATQSTITLTLVPSISDISVGTDTFTLSATFSEIATNYTITNASISTTYTKVTAIPPPRTPSMTPLPTQLPPNEPGYTYTTTDTIVPQSTNTNKTTITSSWSHVGSTTNIVKPTESDTYSFTLTEHNDTITYTNTSVKTIVNKTVPKPADVTVTEVAVTTETQTNYTEKSTVTTISYQYGNATLSVTNTNVTVPKVTDTTTQTIISDYISVTSTNTVIPSETETLTDTFTTISFDNKNITTYTQTYVPTITNVSTTLTEGHTFINKVTNTTVNSTIVESTEAKSTITFVISNLPERTPQLTRTPTPPPPRTPIRTPEQTPSTPAQTPSTDFTVVGTIIETQVNDTTVIVTRTFVVTQTLTSEAHSDSTIFYSTETLKETDVSVVIFTLIDTTTNVVYFSIVNDGQTSDVSKGLPQTTIIILAVIGCAVIFAIAFIALFMYRKYRDKSDSTPSLESQETDDLYAVDNETRTSIIATFNNEDENEMLTTFNCITTNSTVTEGEEDNASQFNDEDDMFLNGEF